MAVSGEVLRAAREAAGLSLSALALRTAYAKPYLSQIETGKRRVLEAHVRAYAQALGLSAEVMAGCFRQGASQTLADLEAALSEARGVEEVRGARGALASSMALRQRATELAEASRGKALPPALALLSHVEQYIGWLYLRLDRLAEAGQHLDRAAVLAVEADDPMRLSTALSFASYRSLRLGQLGTAGTQCEAAGRDKRIHPGMRSYLGYQHAEVLARDTQRTDAHAALRRADSLADQLPERRGAWYVPSFFVGRRALVLNELGSRRAAQSAASEAFGLMPVEWLATGWQRQPLRIRQVSRRLLTTFCGSVAWGDPLDVMSRALHVYVQGHDPSPH